ncbi:MAG: hypothetical protein M1812_006825 [Candelaria pacifica]|nr:MAG: hypothetical protein M1812_006825 [Candelaria pacifica]
MAAPTKHEWIVILPDHEGVLEQRMKVRQAHFDNLELRKEHGFWKLGALLETQPKEGETLKIKGSVMLAQAESKEEVMVALKEDPYYRSNIWDWEKVRLALDLLSITTVIYIYRKEVLTSQVEIIPVSSDYQR